MPMQVRFVQNVSAGQKGVVLKGVQGEVRGAKYDETQPQGDRWSVSVMIPNGVWTQDEVYPESMELDVDPAALEVLEGTQQGVA